MGKLHYLEALHPYLLAFNPLSEIFSKELSVSSIYDLLLKHSIQLLDLSFCLDFFPNSVFSMHLLIMHPCSK